MPDYPLSASAERDLVLIFAYTARNFGRRQAIAYREDLEAVLGLLAKNPRMGREARTGRLDLRRHEHASHVIFYQLHEDSAGIYIVRVLPARADWNERL